MSRKPYLIGISGGSASGKTHFLKQLSNQFKENEVSVISQDDYYLPIHKQVKDKNGIENFDLPESIDFELFSEHLHALRSGKTIEKVKYTFNNPAISPEVKISFPTPVILIEGLFIFHIKEIKNKLDFKIFLEAKDELKLERRISRDISERAYTIEQIKYQWDNHVLPAYKSYLLPYKDYVDLVINNNTDFNNALEVLIHHIKALLLK